ncbi:MAG TPA: hypothetical protein VK508_21460 [Cyclobacteriaceae bacterium]|nr:hypothetical protein [Cyclobacteriaceae bacterium]
MEKQDLPALDKLKERMRFETEMVRLGTIFLLTVGGGVVSLILEGPDRGSEIVFLSFGMILFVIAIKLTVGTFLEVRNLIYQA